MKNTLQISVWAIFATVGFFYLQQTWATYSRAVNPPEVIYKVYKTSTVSTAVFNAGDVIGHLVTRVQFQLPETAYKKLQVPIELLIGDQLFGILNAMNLEKIEMLKNENLQNISQQLEQVLKSDDLPIKNISLEHTEILSK